MLSNTKLNIQEIAEKKKILNSYPFKFYLESTQKCNLNCIMCDHKSCSEDKEFSIELFEKIKPYLKYAEEVDFYLLGEPTLSKNLSKFLKETEKCSFVPKIFTNGTILNKKLLNLFDKRGVFVNISMESADKDIYELIRNGASFEKFKKNVKMYADKYKHRNNDRFHIRLSCTVAIDTLPEVLNIIEFAHDLGIKDLFFGAIDSEPKYMNRNLSCDPEKTVFYFKKAKELADKYKIRFSCPRKIGNLVIKENNNWKNFKLPIDKYSSEYAEAFNPNPLTKDCGYPWIQTIIRANGDVCSCCQRRFVLGNLFKSSFDEIWNGDSYQKLRAQENFRKCYGVGCNMINYSIWPHQISRDTKMEKKI
ncbi:Coenzyme PQQ synthesis protein E [uncultured archaeon]|nr:Coenzyme PQQ synthesis protein E [uncultured archaeon]